MEETRQKSLRRETTSIKITEQKTSFEEVDPEVVLAIHCAIEKKSQDVVLLDLREIVSFTEFFLIVSGNNQRQVQAIADEIREKLKKQNGSNPVRVEGYAAAEWVLLDYGDFICHIFDKKSREFYDLERLWRDARRVDLPPELLPA